MFVLRAPEKYVGMDGGLLGKGSYMQPAKTNKNSLRSIVVCNAISPISIGDIDLNQDQIRCSSTITASSSGRRYAAKVAKPSGGNNEYLIGRQ